MTIATERDQRLEGRIDELRFAGHMAQTRTDIVVELKHIIRRCGELVAQINEVESLHRSLPNGESPLQQLELCDDAINKIIQAKIVLYKIGGVE